MYDYKSEPKHLIFMIDNKSFFASVECVRRGLNPLEAILVIMSKRPGAKNSLVMASSPMAKKKYGIKNVTRKQDLPKVSDIIEASPNMNLYIKRSIEINNIFRKYAAEEDINVYSIDESLVDMTKSWKLFGDTPEEVARKIQIEIRDTLGLYVCVGIGDNPLLAKLALDNEAKNNKSFMARWTYSNVPSKVWKIRKLTDFWGINNRTARRLNKLGLYSISDIAYSDPNRLIKEFGTIGAQLFAHSWGVDRSIVSEKYIPKVKSYSNSQVLPHVYSKKDDIEVVIKEMAEQVAARIRFHHQKTSHIFLFIGGSYDKFSKKRTGFSKSKKITATNSNSVLKNELIKMFRDSWQNEPVLHMAVGFSDLDDDTDMQMNLFVDPVKQVNSRDIDYLVDEIRNKYGFTSIVKASSLSHGATAINRSDLVGGHRGGESYQ
ncbi:Y-family DNA polymerase [Lactobacillus terrae]|uniref:Y-family DNA polymerase n=1 Tax=Lactobacillus terrae TaxID=2269374 RepID=UPI000C1B616D|nr:Y-family DNA polymerase [Lactobacillus terrae]